MISSSKSLAMRLHCVKQARVHFPHMTSHSSTVTLVSVYYAGGDTEEYAPDRTFVSSASSETGSLTICLENTDEERHIFLTLSTRRTVTPVGMDIVRILSPAVRIDLHFSSGEAQQYWMDVLAFLNTISGLYHGVPSIYHLSSYHSQLQHARQTTRLPSSSTTSLESTGASTSRAVENLLTDV